MTVAIDRALPGRRAAGHCRKPTRRLRSRPSCVRWASAGKALTRVGAAGPNRVAFSGRIGRAKLRAGGYRARFTATDAAGNRSATATLRFTIARDAR